jgi:hypothetical protein
MKLLNIYIWKKLIWKAIHLHGGKKKKEKFPILYSFAIKHFSVYAALTIKEKLFSETNNFNDNDNSELFKYLIFLKQNNKNLESINDKS